MYIEHINITVNNIEESTAFYKAIFGFEARWQGLASGEVGVVRAAHVGNETSYLSLFEAEQPGTAPANYGQTGFNHLGFVVASLAPFRERLAELDVQLHLDENYDPGERIYFYDPNGIQVELICYGQG